MARRNIFQNIKEPEVSSTESPASSGYTMRGASRNMLASINELAEKAAFAGQIAEGDAIVELDPEEIEDSFISDRMQDDAAFDELLDAIRERGQDSPILVRPHPETMGRYQVVFGHRRLRAARHLQRKVKAVIRSITNEEHVIAQGQENSARENLSFIERSLFAQRLLDQGYERSTIRTALSVDPPMLTRLLSVSSRVPEKLAVAIGPTKSIGRDRWLDFAQSFEHPDCQAAVLALLDRADFAALPSETRFEQAQAAMKSAARQRRGAAAKPSKEKWQAHDRSTAAEVTDSGRSFAVTFKSKNSIEFGRFIAENLDRFYSEFEQNGER